jgi:cholesterol transport system auxiliary component
MIRPRRGARAAAAALCALVLLPGCQGLQTLQSAATPTQLYTLTPKSTFDPDLPSVAAQIVIEEPTANASFNTDRIAVQPHPLQVQYFGGVRWVERAPLLVQRMLMESFENTDRLRSVGRSAVGLRSDYTLVGDLREFQAEVEPGDPQAPVQVRVRLNLKIIRQPEGLIVASRSFGERLETPSDDMRDVALTFDEALGDVMRDAVEWTLREVDALERRERGERGLLRQRLLDG